MSYARFADDSDVYVFANSDGAIECCGCCLHRLGHPRVEVATAAEMIVHLAIHALAGHDVPASTVPYMLADHAAGELP